jgi:uncharacterized protein (TIGR00290 family)
MEKVILAWSGGKDSAISLYESQRSGKYEIVSLLTTINKDYDRVSMHGVRQILVEQQASSLGLPLEKVFVPKDCSNEEYEARMTEVLTRFKQDGITQVVFGDIFLEWIKEYRENNLAKLGMKGVFPIWGRNTAELTRKFIALGFRAVITCVDTKMLVNFWLSCQPMLTRVVRMASFTLLSLLDLTSKKELTILWEKQCRGICFTFVICYRKTRWGNE